MNDARDLEARAALWLVRREEPGWTSADQADLDSWLDESMTHKAAFWRLEHGWRKADRLAALGPSPAIRPWRNRSERFGSSLWRPIAAAASLLVLIGAALAITVLSPIGEPPVRVADASFATPVGGRRVLSLPDGTRVELNTATSVRTVMSEQRREVWLDSGEAYFEVAHVEGRPFVVHAGSRRVTVLGTKFSVRRDGNKVTVEVVEGRVRIDPAVGRAPYRSATIAAGDIAFAEGSATLVAGNSAERVANDLSWREGMLTFDGLSLGAAATEFNRYNRRQVIVADPEVAAIRIGGTFRATNVEAFVRLLRDAYGLQVEDDGEQLKISG